MKAQYLFNATHPVVRDHTVYGQHLFPGMAYIDFIYQLWRAEGYEFNEFELRDLTIYQPLIVSKEAPLVCEATAESVTPGVWDVAIYPQSESATERGKYATARMHRITPRIFQDGIDFSLLGTTVSTMTGLDEIYERCRNLEVIQTGFMKGEGMVYSLDDMMIADIHPSAEGLENTDCLMFHPALMDAAAVCSAWAVGRSKKTAGLSLPFYCRSFYASALLQGHCIVRARRDSVQHKPDVRYMTIEFCTSSGEKVAEVEAIGSKLVRDPAQIDPARRKSDQRVLVPAGDTGVIHPNKNPNAMAYEIEMSLRKLISIRLGRSVAQIGRDHGYYEMGLDSAALLGLVKDIEAMLGVSLAPTLLFEHTTIGALASYLAEKHAREFDTRSGEKHARNGHAPGGMSGDARQAGNSAFVNHAMVHKNGAAEKPRAKEIAIIGIEGRFPQARNVHEFWSNLRSGKDCIREVPIERWNSESYFHPDRSRTDKTCGKWGGFLDGIEEFDPLFFSIAPREAELMDPQVRLFLEAVWNLLEGAGYTRSRLQKICQGSVGVYVGAMYQHYGVLARDIPGASATAVSSYGAIANRVSYWFGLRGPSMAVDTMCSSSLVALHVACKDLVCGECRMAIVGGVNLSIHPGKYVGLSQLQLLGSQPDRRSFADGDGLIPSEAIGAALLKPLEQAIQDGDNVLAVIKATASNHGGRANGFAVPNLDAQKQVVEDSLKAAQLDSRTISYVEAAATGLALADAVEVAALQKAFCESGDDRQFCAIGSVKSNTGHAEAASGITQLIKVVLQLQHKELAPSIKPLPPNPHFCFANTPFYLQQELTPWRRPYFSVQGKSQEFPRRALINSFGAGGSNATAILEEYVGPVAELIADQSPEEQAYVMVFSARNEDRLRVVVSQIIDYVRQKKELSLPSIAYTLQCGREAMEYRLAMVVTNQREFVLAMEAYLKGDESSAQPAIPLYAGCVGEQESAIRELSSGLSGASFIDLLFHPPDLKKLALLWAHGADVPWENLHAGAEKTVKMAALPTYPFQRQRCWLRTAEHVPAQAFEAAATVSSTNGYGFHPKDRTAEPLSEPKPAELSKAASPQPMGYLHTMRGHDGDLPRTDLERTVAKIWEEVLGVTEVRIKQRFLDLGGNSFTGVQIVSRIRESFDVDLPLRSLLGPQVTVQTLAVAIVSAMMQREESVAREDPIQNIPA
jgi:3-oxoacyl-(acyl-carrier-protein) synthase/acyl carrier protein